MECDKCKIEMRVEQVINGKFYFKCRKCGKEIVKTDNELEEYYNSKIRKVNID